MFELKQISKEAIPAALERAERYRLMKEPGNAESICYDILNVDPDNQQVPIILLLVLSEQFESSLYPSYDKAKEFLQRIRDKYQRSFYEGIIYERRAKSHMKQRSPGSGYMAYGWFQKALKCYEDAIEIRPDGNDDAIMRWNACARIVMQISEVRPEPEDNTVYLLE